ncbi:helix-turn-helix transcriptional regulator [Leifsonia sp. Root112D2]|uniref:helix-turn-helix transcriptional regulator n=1 Tax=Leifsonia sp. Root112D2 TaxID=1736426 RepID=UPI0006F8A85E|nr:AAA family ATPase [Leifsonia sp. Root112D2]KQV07405.1 hypothetical protein ASC63_08935 [Leifsonia sp. Root112D2]
MKSLVASPAMIGRESDLESLNQELAASLGGLSRGVVIGGEAGIGKTRLFEEFAASAARKAFVLVGRCVDLGADSQPYAPIAAVLRSLAAALEREGREHVADEAPAASGERSETGMSAGMTMLLDAAGPGRAGLAALLPELTGTESESQRIGAERLYELVAVLLETVSHQHPLLVMIEDIHWADAATLDLLRFLLRMLSNSRILIVLSYRSDEVPRGHPLRATLPELDRSRSVVRWELGRLSREQVAAQAEAILGHPADIQTVDCVYERSEGVPFFVEELLGLDGADDGDVLPQTLRELLLARYERLSESTQQVLRMLAAGGVCVDYLLLEAVHDGSADALDAAAREAMLANVLTADERQYSFRHALVREAVLTDLLPGERTRFHTRYARAYESGVGGERVASKVSYHWMAAHEMAMAFPATVEAMTEARAAYAYDTAARMGERALELWDRVQNAEQIAGLSRVDMLGQTAYMLRNAGDSERAIALVTIALEQCDPADRARRARLLRDKASYLANLGRIGSTQMLRDAIELLHGEPPSELRAVITGELAARLMLEARYDEAIEAASVAFEEANAVGSVKRMSVSSNLRGVARVNHGDIVAGQADLERARELAEGPDGDDGALLRYRVNASDVAAMLGRYDEAVRIAEEGIRRAGELGVSRTSGVMLAANTIEPLLAAGEWKRAGELLDAALALAPPPGFRIQLQRLKLWITVWGGDAVAADELLREWRPAMRVHAEIDMQSGLAIAYVAAEIAMALGDAQRAWAESSVVIAQDHRIMPSQDQRLIVVAARALAVLRAGAADARDDEGRAKNEAAEEWGTDASNAAECRLRAALDSIARWPTAAIWIALLDAELGGDARDGTDVAAWQHAVELAGEAMVPVHIEPYARYRLARVQARAGDRRTAARNATVAREAASRIGAQLVVDWVDTLVERAGLERPAAGGDPAGGSRLTDRESQVLELLGQGLSNRQIGERLFISAKTASVHVSAILKKVGASTRTEAVYRARGSGD